MGEMSDVLTTQEACKFLKISRPKMLSYFYSGEIAAKKISKGWRVFRGELVRFILGQKGHFKVRGQDIWVLEALAEKEQKKVKERKVDKLTEMVAQKIKQLGPKIVAKIQDGDAWVKISVIENGFNVLEVE